MFRIKPILRVLKIFYLFGQSPAYIQLKTFHPNKFVTHILTILFLILFLILLPIIAMFQHDSSNSYSLTNHFVNLLFLFTIFLCSIVVCVTALCLPNHMQSLAIKFEFIIHYLAEQLQIYFKLKQFIQIYYFKCALIFFSWLLVIIIKTKIATNIIPIKLFTAWSFLLLMKTITVMHILFFIDLLHCSYKALNSHCESISCGILVKTAYSTNITYVSVLRHYKYMHFKLWACGNIINQYFGWILLILFVISCLEVTYALYWVFVYTAEGQRLRTIRKYFVLFHLLVTLAIKVFILLLVH